jgi:SAM-dependent MidA family methyltransferase
VSFGTFVDQALFGKDGFYAAGRVQFGDGGHFETFPTALSPLFGRIVAERGYALWWETGRPQRFEIFEVGAGDGQLALDALCHVTLGARRGERRAAFARALRYVICERSAALVERQRARLRGLPLARKVRWVTTDLLRRDAVGRARLASGFVVINEVLDCLPHERVVMTRRGDTRATWVTRCGERGRWRFAPHEAPIAEFRALCSFLRRFRPEMLAREEKRHGRRGAGGRRPVVYFACPALVPFLDNVTRLYQAAEIWLIDYGRTDLHRRAAERGKMWIGTPHGGRAPAPQRVFADPGNEDITFLVDFEVVARVAEAAGLDVELLGPQGALAERAGVPLGPELCGEIVRHRVLAWCLSVIGAPEVPGNRAGAIGFGSHGASLVEETQRSLAEFGGERPSLFRACVLVRRPSGRILTKRSPVRAGPPRAPGET